jgi:hypothetical protein
MGFLGEDSFRIASSATSALKFDKIIFFFSLDSGMVSPMTFFIISIQDNNFAFSNSERLYLSLLNDDEDSSISSLSSNMSGSMINEAIFCSLLRSNKNCSAVNII